MKLHLPTRLRAAVLACFAVVTSFTTTLATGVLSGGAFAVSLAAVSTLAVSEQAQALSASTFAGVDTSADYTGTGFTYTAETGLLSGAGLANDITFDLKYGALQPSQWFIYTDSGSAQWGLGTTADGNIRGYWNNTPGGQIAEWDNPNNPTCLLENVSSLAAGGAETVLLTAEMSGSGVALAAGGSVAVGTSGNLYNCSSLHAGSSTPDNSYIDKSVITRLYVADTAGTYTWYTAGGFDVVLAADAHVNATAGRVVLNGGASGSAAATSATRNPIFVGGAGQLFLEAWGQGAINMDNDIYLGSSTYSDVASYGVLRFGNNGGADKPIALNGTITVLEDTSLKTNGGDAININGAITDKKHINGLTSTGGKTLTIGGRGYTLSGRVDVSNVVLLAASGVNFGGEVAVGDLTLNGDSSATFSGSDARLGALSTAAASTLTVAGGGNLTLGGTVELGSAIVNNGTLAFANDVQLNLSGLTAADGVYTLFTGNEVAGFADLNVDNITGINTVGYDWEFNANGTITSTINSEAYVYSGGTLSWDTTSASFDGNKTFANGGVVVFKGNSTVSLAQNITASSVVIDEGVSVALSGSGNNLTATQLHLYGTLVLNDNALNAASRVSGAGNLHIGGEVIISDRATLSGFTNTITVLSGGVLKANGTASGTAGIFGNIYGTTGAPVIVVENGGVVDINGKADIYYKVTLKEGATYANTSSTGITDGSRQLPVLVLEGDATITANAELGMRASNGSSGVPVLTLNGHTLTKNGSGIFFLHNTTADAGTIMVEAGTLAIKAGGTYTNTNINVGAGATLTTNGATLNGTVTVGDGATFQANGGTYTGTSVTLEEGGSLVYRTGANSIFKAFNTTGAATFDAAEGNYNMTVTDASVIGGRLTKTNVGGLIWSNSVTLAGGIDIQRGTVTFNGAAKVSGTLTVASGATLNVGESGSVIVGNLGGFAVKTPEPVQNGLANVKYRILDNSGTSNITSVTYNGASHTLTDGNLSLSDLYYVISDTVTAGGSSATVDTNRATGFVVKNGAVLDIQGDAGSALNVHKIVTTTSGSGTMILRSSTTLTDGAETVFAGDLEIASGTQFSLGANAAGGATTAQTASITSLNSVVLNGGTLFVRGIEGNLGSIVSKAGSTGSVLRIHDMAGADGVASGTISLEKLELNADMSLHCNWKSNVDIALLTGSGDLAAQHYFRAADGGRSDCGDTLNLNISSLNGYTGAISMIGGDKGLEADVNMNVATGASGVSMKGISISNSTLNLVVKGTSSMSEGLKLIGEDFNGVRGSTATIAIAPGAAFSGPVIVEGPGNTLTSSQGGMNLSQLNVAEGAALDLNGAVSALLMNQAGTVDIAGMSLTDGAVLTYGDAANLLSVTDGMLAGNVIIDSGLMLTDVGVNLGLSSAIAQDRISLDNYAGGSLQVVDGSWYLKARPVDPSELVNYYFESPSGLYWKSAIWSLTDNDTSSTVSLPADDRSKVVLVFSDSGTEASPILLKLNATQSARSLEIVNGYYEFQTEDNSGTIACTGDLVLGAGGHLKQNLHINASNLSMAADSSLEIGKTLKLSGAVNVTGAGAAIGLGSGQSLKTSGVNVSGADSSLSLSGFSGAGATQALGSVSLGDNTRLTLKDGVTDITATATALSLGTGAAIVLEANQVLDLTAIEDMDDEDTGKFSKLLNATSGAGTLKVSMPGQFRMKTDTAVNTNLETAQLKINSYGTGGKTLTVMENRSITLTGRLIMQSTAKTLVAGGSVTAEYIELGYPTEAGNPGHFEMSSGMVITKGFVHSHAGNTITMSDGTLDITSTTGISNGIDVSITGGTLVASGASGWGMTGASVGGAAVSADSAGKVTMTNTTVTGNITGNDKLVLAGTVHATANATVSGASVGGITVTTTDANKLTLNNTTIGTAITNNGELGFSGTQNVTLAGSSATKYADDYGSTDYGDNGYMSTVDVYTLVSGTAATAATGTIWQVNGVALSGKPTFDGKVLTHITEDAAGKVYYINSGTVVYETGAGCTEADKLQFNGGKLELKTELAANKLSMGTGAAAVLMGDGTLNLGTGTALASGISLGTETDAKWAGTVKVAGASLTDAALSGLGIAGSTIELNDTDGTLKGGTYNAAVKLTNGSEVSLGANNNFASLDATGGSLSIAGVGNIISTLTMANNATLELNLSKMGVKDLGNWNAGPMLTVTTLDTATPGSKLNVSALVSQEAMLTLANGRSKVLATITNCNADLDALKLNGLEEQVLTGIGGMEYKYTLERVDGTNEVNLIVKASNVKDGWVAADSDPNSIADTTWTDADTADDVKWAGVVGSFYGKGNATVHIEEDGVTMDAVDANGNPIGVIVSADANLDVSEYTFTGGMLNTALLAVNQGGLVLDNAGVNAGMYVILSNDAKLTVNAKTVLTVGKEQGADEGAGMMGSFVSVGGKAKLINEGTTTIHGTLSVADTAAVSNSGILTVDAVSAQGATINNTGTFIVAGGGIIGKLTGEGALENAGQLSVLSDTTLSSLTNSGTLSVSGNLTVNSAVTQGGTVTATNVTVNGDAAFTSLTTGKLKASSLTVKDATITTLDTDKLTVGGGTVAVTNDVTLAALSGTGTLKAAGKVSLTSSVDTKVNVSAAEIELADGGNSLGSLSTDAITMLEGSKLSTESALLTVNSVSSLSGAAIGIDVSESAFAALDILADGRYAAGNYLLIDGADSAAMFTYVNGQHLDAIIATGMNAGLTVNNGTLSLSVSEITNEAGEVVGMVWDTTNGNTTTNNGVGIDTDAGFYKALDYVKQVLVTEDVTFDLSADSVGDSVAGNTSDPVSGLLIRNLSGSGELTIKGNTSAQDVATLMNTPGREISAVGLTADAATVNLGLSKGAEGYLLSDLSSTGPTLKSLNLVNRSVVNVNSNTEVLGDTDVADHTRLIVKEGNTLTTGMLSGTDEAEISGVIRVTKGGVYTGTYDEASVIAAAGSNLRLRSGGRRSMSLQVNNGGQVTLDSAAQDGSMDNLRVGESPMARAMSIGSATLNILNTTVTDDGINHSTITLTEDEGNYINKSEVTLSLGAAETARTLSSPGSPVVIDGMVDVLNSSITVNMLGNSVKNGALEVNTESDKDLTLARFVTGGHVEGNTVTLTGTPEMKALLEKYYTNARLDSKGNIKVDRVTDYYGSRMQLSDNARVGIDMADAALVKLNPQANRGSYKDLAEVLDTLDTAVATGNRQTADELGAAVSGASVAALGAAVAGDVERQLMGIRNRTTTMGVDQTQVNENMPYFNAWINAEGDFRRMDEDGTAAGYELSSWGGTVGFDVDMTPRLTMGLAATAMYGDFTAKSADHAEGDLDTYYVTAFARYAANRWSHTFVATAGMADTSLKRTVSHAGGSYSTEGDAEGVSFGFLYELGYVVAMNESATACLQPVFNVMLSHSSLDGYTEEGSDAALRMGGVDMTTVTFGMGARAQAIVGTNLYNRSSMVEGRALLKVRTGDTEAEAENALGAVPGAMGSVKAAELGTIGAELGVGITVPMGSDGGSIFADASLEVGSGYTNINGTVGYRINF